MRVRLLAEAPERRLARRLSYCGTCKTLGRRYGQRTRLLLNHDTVFLAEVLCAVSGEPIAAWHPAFQSYSCAARLPEAEGSLPLPLELAAAATIVLAEFRVADAATDTRRPRYRALARLLSGSFREATARLAAWDFPLEELRTVLHSQETREDDARRSERPPADVLAALAEPTARATSLFFAEGARLVGRPDAAPALARLGRAFGELAYLLDAFEDFAPDVRSGEFNAFRAAFRLDGGELAGPIRETALAAVRAAGDATQDAIAAAPIEASLRQAFAGRLASNLDRHLGMPAASCCAVHAQAAWRGRWERAVAASREARDRFVSTGGASFAARTAALLVFASVLPIAFVSASQVKDARSYPECLGLVSNLMFLGALFGLAAKPPLKKKPDADGSGSGGSGGGDESCCCDCDSCGDCDCGDCSCDC